MKLIISPTSGLVLDLDTVPANPAKVDPITGAPLDKHAVDHLFPEAVDPQQPTFKERCDVRKQALVDVDGIVSLVPPHAESKPKSKRGRKH